MAENIKLAFFGIWRHKFRSILTMMGIIIGISAMIAIVSTIQGINNQLKHDLAGSGNNSVVVQLYEGDYPLDMSRTLLTDGIVPIDKKLRDEIADLNTVSGVSLYTSRSVYDNVYYQDNALTGGMLYGVDRDYLDLYGYSLKAGRLFAPKDYSYFRKVAVVDQAAVTNIFEGDLPLGKVIDVMGEPFTVIGVVGTDAEIPTEDIHTPEDYYTLMNQDSGAVFIPDSTWPLLYRYDEPQTIAVQTRNTDDMTGIGARVSGIVNESLGLAEEGRVQYKSENLMRQAQELRSLSGAMRNQLMWIAGIALIVGGVGVMNVMLVSVTERSREIGLKKAIGARKSMILVQFLTEAAVLTCTGGIVGVAGGIVLSAVVSSVTEIPWSVSVWSILVSVIFSVVIGLVFGVIPAVKAANQNPIEALRRT